MTVNRALPLAFLFSALLGGAVLAQEAPPIPERPEDLQFPPLAFEPPAPTEFRHELSNGVVVFLAPSRELPLIDLNFVFQGGGYLDPVGHEGLASATGALLRRGGTEAMKPEALDDRLDFLAAQVNIGASEYRINAGLNTLSRNFTEAFQLFLAMLRTPGFDPERTRLFKSEVLEQLKQRNDSADSIEDREWTALMYGRDHFKGRLVTQASLDAITQETMRAFHAEVVHPGNLFVAVSGDFEPKAMLASLEEALAGWEAKERSANPPAPTHELVPGVYHVEKDIPQGKVVMGLRGIQRDNPDAVALQVMSRILGSGGFTSRIMQRVRSEEGLAYSAGSYVIPGLYFPGEMRAFFQSKNRTVALAIQIILQEIARIRSEPVSEEELNTVKEALVESFPQNFSGKAKTIGTYLEDAMTGRPFSHWQTYRDRVRAVDAAEVQRVAQKYMVPERMAILVVGKWSEIEPGDLKGRAKMAEFFQGKATELPLRDPLTQEPLK